MDGGEQCAMMDGMYMTPLPSVDSWDTMKQVWYQVVKSGRINS